MLSRKGRALRPPVAQLRRQLVETRFCSYNIYIVKDLETILQLPDGPPRTAALAEWVQGLYPEGTPRPVLVGGAAVELLTGGAYSTGDLDFVGEVPPEVQSELEEHGFERQGRHWIHPEAQIFLEFPGEHLQEAETSLQLDFSGARVEILSPEAVLIDRLAAWEFWGLDQEGINAFLVWRASYENLDDETLRVLVMNRKLEAAWGRFLQFAERYLDREPATEELSKWANKQES